MSLKCKITCMLALVFVSCCSPERETSTTAGDELISFPTSINSDCENGRAKLFDECGDQIELFNRALSIANDQNKVLLVSYGAEWCIWCHVFEAHIRGKTNTFTYTYGEPESDLRERATLREKPKRDVSAEAEELAAFVSKSFVLVHIEYERSGSGDLVLDVADAWDAFEGSIPYIFTTDSSGKFVATYAHDDVEVRRDNDSDWYRGYDRQVLLVELQRMADAARDRSS